jgi:SAM-dependent methyltransferase
VKKFIKKAIAKSNSEMNRFLNFFKWENLNAVFRKTWTFWVAKRTLPHLEAIRAYELDVIFKMLPAKGKFLEIGAGAGWQAQTMQNHGYEVSGIDLASSNYKADRVWPVIEYDGKNIPFADNTFDIVFSSNTLEHIPHIYDFQKEILRVLKPDGIALHILPSGSWRFWTNIAEFLDYRRPIVHGELAKGPFSEIFYFRRGWWTKLFTKTGWKVIRKRSNRLFYSGNSLMDSRLGIKTRNVLSIFLGGSCNIFVLRKK